MEISLWKMVKNWRCLNLWMEIRKMWIIFDQFVSKGKCKLKLIIFRCGDEHQHLKQLVWVLFKWMRSLTITECSDQKSSESVQEAREIFQRGQENSRSQRLWKWLSQLYPVFSGLFDFFFHSQCQHILTLS